MLQPRRGYAGYPDPDPNPNPNPNLNPNPSPNPNPNPNLNLIFTVTRHAAGRACAARRARHPLQRARGILHVSHSK